MNKIITIIRESRTARFLIPAGLMLIVCGIIFSVATYKNRDYVKTTATVTKSELAEEAYTDAQGNHVDATYTVYIKYTVDGKEYEAELSGMPEYQAGKKLDLYYNPEDPSLITQSKSMIIPIALTAGGIAALIGGIISVINTVKRLNKMKKDEEAWANGDVQTETGSENN